MFNNQEDLSFNFKQYFVPLTTVKAIRIIIILGIIVFINSLFNGFVLDDKIYIISNPSEHSINLAESFLSTSNLFNFIKGGQYRPLPALYFSLLYSLFSTTPFFYHFLSLMIHITNTILLFFLLKHFFNKTLSLLLSLVFLVHPLQVEAVSWIASADNLLFFLFGISALLLSLKEHVSWKRLIIVCCLLLLSLLTKETAVIFIFLVLLYKVLFKKRQKFFLFIGAAFTLTTYAFIRFVLAGVYFEHHTAPMIERAAFEVRLLTIPAVIFYYVKNLLYPSNLGVFQYWVVRTKDFPHFYFPLFIDILFLLVLLFLGGVIARANKKEFPVYLFSLAWLVVGLIFHSQLFPLDMTVADRWMYFPIVGLLGVVGVSIQVIKLVSKNRIAFGLTLGVILISLLSLRTIIRNTNWSDEARLLGHDLDTYHYGITAQEGWFGQVR